MRFYLVDKIKELVPGKKAEGVKCWSLDNQIFQDHFPGYPTTPGVLLTESMAQLSGILVEHSYYSEFGDGFKVYPVLSIIRKAKFRKFVQPGDQCIIKAKMISIDRGHAVAEIKTYVEDDLMCETTLNFLIGLEKDMKDNPYIVKMDQYYRSILPKEFIK